MPGSLALPKFDDKRFMNNRLRGETRLEFCADRVTISVEPDSLRPAAVPQTVDAAGKCHSGAGYLRLYFFM